MQKSVACRLMPEISRCRAVILKQIDPERAGPAACCRRSVNALHDITAATTFAATQFVECAP